jgi:diguanylate cyclase (GGDEF)-like protein/PAS domain S-box-containing protein
MRAGAKDYVKKGDMARLLPSIEREVGEARNRARGQEAALAQARAEDALKQSELRFLQLAEAMPECFWLIDLASRRVVYVNPAYERIWGERCADLLADRMDWLRYVHPEDQARLAAAMETQRHGGVDEEFRVLRQDGSVRWLQVFTFPMRDRGSEVNRVGGVARDITENKAQREALRASEADSRHAAQVVRAVLDALPAYIAMLDEQGVITSVNAQWPQFAEGLELAGGEFKVGANYVETCARVAAAGQAEAAEMGRGIRAVIQGEETGFSLIYPCHSATEKRWFRVNVSPLATAASRGAVVMHTNVTERMEAEQRLVQLAHYDSLTELPNRLLFRDRLEHALTLARRNDWRLALIFIDLDRFKVVNDTLGHLAGDRLLQEVSRRLRGALRASDTVGRLGGDEFAVLIPKLAENQEAAVVARKIIEVLGAPYELDGNEVFSSGSLGITVFPSDAEDSENLIRHADTAMYRAKEVGRNNYQFYTTTMNERALEKMQLESDLRRALAHDEFVLHFQPKVSCITGKVFGVEALLRWQHPGRGLVSPGDFIPMLEESGLIIPVGEWVLREACSRVAEWHRERLPQVSVSVNVSGAQLASTGLFEQVKEVLDSTGLEPRFLDLELTESLLMRDADQAIATLDRLKNIGVHISVDDFGTGYSSLSYLKRIPLDWVKVDRSFVQDITADPNDASITRAVITMAHNLQLKVIAEGVETEGQLGLLIANKCDAIQGYYFSRPIPAEEMVALLQSGRQLDSNLLPGKAEERTLLLVDDEENILMALKRLLRRDGYKILTAAGGHEGLEVLSRNRVDVIVSDQRMPGMTGVEFLRRVKDIHPEVVSIVLSGYTELQSVTDAINEGAIYKFLTKPWDDEHLRANIQEAFRRKEMADENRRLAREIQTSNAELARANEQLAAMVQEKSRRLLLGETVLGTMHEVVQNVPWAIIGVAPDGLVAVANTAAEKLFGAQMPMFGRFADETLPEELVSWLKDEGSAELSFEVSGACYRVSRRPMGLHSAATGALLVFEPISAARVLKEIGGES